MMRKASLPLFLLALAACPKDKKGAGDSVPVVQAPPLDTTPTDLSQVTSNIPEAAPDTFTRRKLTPTGGSTGGSQSSYSNAPAPLQAAVEREQAFQRFCFQERGLKSDPSLRGNVAMLVTVSSSGISGTEVANSRWSSSTGRAVNSCLEEKAHQAWKLTPGAVKPGKYVVQLSFVGG